MFCKFLRFFGASEPGISPTPRLRRDKLTWTALGSALPLRSRESRASEAYPPK
jgi:hypothetical protein